MLQIIANNASVNRDILVSSLWMIRTYSRCRQVRVLFHLILQATHTLVVENLHEVLVSQIHVVSVSHLFDVM